MFIAPPIGRWLWKRFKTRSARRQGLPATAATPNPSAPQKQVEAMEREVDVPGGIRP